MSKRSLLNSHKLHYEDMEGYPDLIGTVRRRLKSKKEAQRRRDARREKEGMRLHDSIKHIRRGRA